MPSLNPIEDRDCDGFGVALAVAMVDATGF
jgi:hypothetical protein